MRDEESYMYMSPFTKWPQQLGSSETIGMSVRMGGRWEDRMGTSVGGAMGGGAIGASAGLPPLVSLSRRGR